MKLFIYNNIIIESYNIDNILFKFEYLFIFTNVDICAF